MNRSVRAVAQQIETGLRKLPEDKATEVPDLVEFLVTRYASVEPVPHPARGPQAATVDPQDALLDDPSTLLALYAEFAVEDRELAQVGLAHYARMLGKEETSP